LRKSHSTGKSLEEVHGTIETASPKGGAIRKFLAFSGPAYLISVGYMDPGNWATDIAGGSQFGYKLIWVLVMSNIMALILQSLSARLGIVRGLDLAQVSKESYSRSINIILYLLAEIAIVACDLAEVLGMAIGLQLLFHLPIIWGVCLTLLDTFLLLFLINRGMRMMEAFILALIGIIGFAFLLEVFFAKPHVGQLLAGFIPSLPGTSALYIGIGIIGATVMPHNLYLHSSLVQSRKFERSRSKIREAIRFNILDSVVALNIAFLVNAAILVLAAATFYRAGLFQVSEIQDAYKFLQPLLGTKIAPLLFAFALIASGQSSTLTGTLAGQVVMEGYLNLRIQPWIRRIITRLLAIIPAVITIALLGEGSTGKLLILSQVVLSLQLGFAVVPLIHFVSDKKKMGEFSIGIYVKMIAWLITAIIIILNAKLIMDQITDWLKGPHPLIIILVVIPVSVFAGLLLLFITFKPALSKIISRVIHTPHKAPDLGNIRVKPTYSRVAIAVDFSKIDTETIRHALSICNTDTKILIIHVVESAGALILGKDISDFETKQDGEVLERYRQFVIEQGFDTSIELGFGNPRRVIPNIVKEFDADLLVMGAHGHQFIKDIIFGTTIEKVRHRLKIPVLIVR
jgi:manganese transport protein